MFRYRPSRDHETPGLESGGLHEVAGCLGGLTILIAVFTAVILGAALWSVTWTLGIFVGGVVLLALLAMN